MTFSLADVRPLLGPLCDEGLIIIGGQALYFWAEVLSIESTRPLASKDLDVQGTPAAGERAAQTLGGVFRRAPNLDTTNAGNISLEHHGQPLQIDVLIHTFGLAPGEAEREAATAQVDGVQIRILHPFSVMKSRFANVDGLRRTDAHSLNQARLAVECLGAFVAKYAGPEPKMMRTLSNRVFKYARAKRARKLYLEHGLDAFMAVQPLAALGLDFVEKNYPQMDAEISSRR